MLGAVKWVLLIRCLIPRYKLPEEIAKSIIAWCLSSLDELPLTVCIIVIQWVLGMYNCIIVTQRVENDLILILKLFTL